MPHLKGGLALFHFSISASLWFLMCSHLQIFLLVAAAMRAEREPFIFLFHESRESSISSFFESRIQDRKNRVGTGPTAVLNISFTARSLFKY